MHAACAQGGAIQGLTRVINHRKPYNHFVHRTYKVPEVQHMLCGQQGRRLSDPRAHLYIKPSRSYSHCANRSYIVPEAHRTNYACCMRQGRRDPRAHLSFIHSKLYIYSANKTYQVPEVHYNYMRAARLQVEQSKASPPYQA